MRSHHLSTTTHYPEAGNALIFILIAVVLFGALTFTVSRGFQSETSTNMSDREYAVHAADILSYTQKIERTVNRMRQKGCSENEINFSYNGTSAYDFSTRNKCKVFGSSGGSLEWQSPFPGVNDGTEWLITGSTCVEDLENGGSSCDSDSTSNEELIMILPNVTTGICTALNDKLSITSTPADSGDSYSSTEFVGTYADDTRIAIGDNYNSACYSYDGNKHFYHVLIAR